MLLLISEGVILKKSGRIIQITFIINIILKDPSQPFPVQTGQHWYHQQGHDNTPVTDNRTQIIHAETNGQQDRKTKEDAEIDKGPGTVFPVMPENKNHKE